MSAGSITPYRFLIKLMSPKFSVKISSSSLYRRIFRGIGVVPVSMSKSSLSVPGGTTQSVNDHVFKTSLCKQAQAPLDGVFLQRRLIYCIGCGRQHLNFGRQQLRLMFVAELVGIPVRELVPPKFLPPICASGVGGGLEKFQCPCTTKERLFMPVRHP